MSDEIVRCPYCVLGSEFRPMSPRSDGFFVCGICGHTATPVDSYAKCLCPRCRRMNRAADNLGREFPPMASAANS